MKIYLAGTPGIKSREDIWQAVAKRRLLSFADILLDTFNVRYAFDLIMNRMDKKVELFLDSGAFSAWSRGVEIDIDEYITFIKEHSNIISIYANLDVIGGDAGVPGEETARRTLENQRIMEEAGLSPLPVFHYGEPYEYLERYVEEYDYIALGVAGNSGTKLIPWLNECFSKYICDEKGYPKVKVHGFAVTSLVLMVRYPWRSVDSTSWVITSRMGSIFIPRYRNGKWIYDEQSWKIAVSARSPKKKDSGMHIETLFPTQKKVFLDYIHSKGFKLGKSDFTYVDKGKVLSDGERWAEPAKKGKNQRLMEVIIEPGLCNIYQMRDQINIMYFLDLEKNLPEWPWPYKREEVTNGFF